MDKLNKSLKLIRPIYKITDSIHAIDVTRSIFPGGHMHIRTTIITLADGLLIMNPVASDLLSPQLATLNKPIRYILAPNGYHHLWAHELASAYPEATLLSSDALPLRHPEKKWGTVIKPKMNTDFLGDEVELKLLQCFDSFREVVVLHKKSRTLLVTDLAFNTVRSVDYSRGMKMLLVILGGWDRANVTWPYRFVFKKNAKGLLKELAQILDWDWDRLVFCHGDVIESGGKEALRNGTYKYIEDIATNEDHFWCKSVATVVFVAAVSIGVACFASKQFTYINTG